MATDVTPEQVLRAAAAGDGYLAIGPHAPRWITDELVARGHGTYVLGERNAPLGFRINNVGRINVEKPVAQSTDDTPITSGPDHYTAACQLLNRARKHFEAAERGDISEYTALTPDLNRLIRFAQTHALLAIAAGIGGLDAVEGPGGGSATGRYSVADADRWATVTGALSDPTPATSPPPISDFIASTIERCPAEKICKNGETLVCNRTSNHEGDHRDSQLNRTWSSSRIETCPVTRGTDDGGTLECTRPWNHEGDHVTSNYRTWSS